MSGAQPHTGLVSRRVRRISDGQALELVEELAEEAAVALTFNGEPHAVMMGTPLDLEDFALGFALSERIIASPQELLDYRRTELDGGVQLSLQIPPERMAALRGRQRSLEGRSSCGLCGLRQIADALRPAPHAGAGIVIEPPALQRALRGLQEAQPLNAASGAVHAAAWADAQGRLLELREDVGRHNALDKLIGALARAGIDTEQGFVLLTSRASYEMVQKSAAVGISLLAAISAPTALAVELADDAGMTLIGFARGERCTVYTRPGRMRLADARKTRAEGIQG